MQAYENVMNKIISHFAGPKFHDEVVKAKKIFFENAGILDEDSDHYDLRMSQFLDWYFFSYHITEYKRTPLDAAVMVRDLRFDDGEFKILQDLKNQNHSLFEFIKIKGRDVYVKDLLKNKKVVVEDCPWQYGFNESELFEARLIPAGKSCFFTKGFCFHPAEAKKYILGEVKKWRKDPDLDPEVLMMKLLKMRYKFEQYKHVKFDMIYSNDSKLSIKEA